MGKKTMGSFIAALRKAQGLTQRELAQRLNVSDKSVSRWERDEGAPDLSVIPALAEVFGVTCDELLRGERSPVSKLPAETAAGSTAKGEKQRRLLLRSTLSQYRSRTLIGAGIAGLGLIAAAVGNLALLRAYLGFCAGLVFLLVAAIWQAVALNSAFGAVADAEIAAEEKSGFHHAAVRLTQWAAAWIVAILGFCLPLVEVAGDAYLGVDAKAWLFSGILQAAIGCGLVGIVSMVWNMAWIKHGVWKMEEPQRQRYASNHRLLRRCALVLAVALTVTGTVHWVLNQFYGAWNCMKGQKFEDYPSFVEYMEEPQQANVWAAGPVYPQLAPESQMEEAGSVHYYDADGNEIEGPPKNQLKDQQGRVVCEYYEQNQNVVNIQCSEQRDTLLPIWVFTYDDLRKAQQRVTLRNLLFIGLYGVQIALAVGVYWKKRVR